MCSDYAGNRQLTETEHETMKKTRINGHNVMENREGTRPTEAMFTPKTSCTFSGTMTVEVNSAMTE